MKRTHLSISFLLILSFTVRAQITQTYGNLIFEDTLDLKPQSNWIIIPDSSSNLWEIGMPDKAYFNAAHTSDYAIMTDTNDFYTSGCNDYFYLSIPYPQPDWWGEGILSFYHKFDTDTLTDGCTIELSYDNGNTWLNVMGDTNHINTVFIGLYSDTLNNGTYAFSGKSNGWQYVELYWFWIALVKQDAPKIFFDTLMVKFTFTSDNINTNKEGWMLDDIVFRGYSVTGFINEADNSTVKVYPVPSSDKVIFESDSKALNGLDFILYDITGKIVKTGKISEHTITITDLKNGLYFYEILMDNEVFRGKIVKG